MIETPHLDDRDWLVTRYITQAQSTAVIARELGCTGQTVIRALRRHGIPLRKHTSRYPELHDKEWLRQKYVDERMSAKRIAKLIGSTPGNVYAHLRAAGIPTRSLRDGIRNVDGDVIRQPSTTRAASIRQAVAVKKREGRHPTGEKHHRWNGGRTRDTQGYVRLLAPGHPRATLNNPYVYEHILVMEQQLGRYLDPDTEIVHHRNHVKDDNRPENLELKSKLSHIRDHWAQGKRAAEAELEAAQLRAENERLKAENERLKAHDHGD
jgi:transposase-like protein